MLHTACKIVTRPEVIPTPSTTIHGTSRQCPRCTIRQRCCTDCQQLCGKFRPHHAIGHTFALLQRVKESINKPALHRHIDPSASIEVPHKSQSNSPITSVNSPLSYNPTSLPHQSSHLQARDYLSPTRQSDPFISSLIPPPPPRSSDIISSIPTHAAITFCDISVCPHTTTAPSHSTTALTRRPPLSKQHNSADPNHATICTHCNLHHLHPISAPIHHSSACNNNIFTLLQQPPSPSTPQTSIHTVPFHSHSTLHPPYTISHPINPPPLSLHTTRPPSPHTSSRPAAKLTTDPSAGPLTAVPPPDIPPHPSDAAAHKARPAAHTQQRHMHNHSTSHSPSKFTRTKTDIPPDIHTHTNPHPFQPLCKNTDMCPETRPRHGAGEIWPEGLHGGEGGAEGVVSKMEMKEDLEHVSGLLVNVLHSRLPLPPASPPPSHETNFCPPHLHHLPHPSPLLSKERFPSQSPSRALTQPEPPLPTQPSLPFTGIHTRITPQSPIRSTKYPTPQLYTHSRARTSKLPNSSFPKGTILYPTIPPTHPPPETVLLNLPSSPSHLSPLRHLKIPTLPMHPTSPPLQTSPPPHNITTTTNNIDNNSIIYNDAANNNNNTIHSAFHDVSHFPPVHSDNNTSSTLDPASDTPTMSAPSPVSGTHNSYPTLDLWPKRGEGGMRERNEGLAVGRSCPGWTNRERQKDERWGEDGWPSVWYVRLDEGSKGPRGRVKGRCEEGEGEYVGKRKEGTDRMKDMHTALGVQPGRGKRQRQLGGLVRTASF